jgi:hypothetical protein
MFRTPDGDVTAQEIGTGVPVLCLDGSEERVIGKRLRRFLLHVIDIRTDTGLLGVENIVLVNSEDLGRRPLEEKNEE